MPVVGPKSAAVLREFVDYPEPPLATEDWIEKQIVVLSVKPQRGRSAVEAQMLINAYVPIMAEHSRVDLGYAIGRLMRESKWFPDISEIVELAVYAKGQRDFKRIQAATLVAKHEREWTPPIPEDQRVAPEEVAALVAELRVGADKEG
jgi:hypothetical protein